VCARFEPTPIAAAPGEPVLVDGGRLTQQGPWGSDAGEVSTGSLPKFFDKLRLPLSNGRKIRPEGISVRLWLELWGGRVAAWLAKKDGNVFIENGIWIIIV
jgi:hypothetical protein